MYQFTYSLNPMLTYIEANLVIGASGAPGTLKSAGNFITSITRVSAGTYKINLQQPLNRYLGGNTGFVSPTTSSSTATVSGAASVITVLGTATLAQWQAVGLLPGVVPAVGAAFVASTTATIGGGAQAGQPSNSGIATVEVIGNANLTIANPQNPYMLIQCLAPTSSSVTTHIPTDPASGSVMGLQFMFRNSSVGYPNG